MHTIWKGSISFGLVNVPVKMHSATESHDFQFNYLHKACHNRIKYSKRCPVCDVEVSADDIVKGYEFDKGRFVILEDEDFEAVAKPLSRSIDILDFVNLSEIDPIYFQKSYYLSPEETAQKAYRLLCAAMEETGKVALARVVLRSKQYLACLRVYEGSLVMETMYYPDEIRHIDGEWKKIQPTETELELAKRLIDQLARPFAPGKYRDEAREELREMIERKIAGQLYEPEPAVEKRKVFDLMEALSLSIAQHEKDQDDPEKVSAGPAPDVEAGARTGVSEPATLTPRKRTRKSKGA